jgi:uncharacterized membrane protein YphA (DoxX/SURF4 family)
MNDLRQSSAWKGINPSRFVKTTFGSSLGPDSATADCWLRLHRIAVPAPHFMAWLTILSELIGGLAVLLGAFVALVSLPRAALLLVTMFTVHLPYGFSSIKRSS